MNNTPNIIGAEEGRPYSLTYKEQLLNIGTLNVKGFNALGKQLITFSIFRMEHHLDIIGLTETKTKKNENKILSNTKNTKKIDKKIKKNIYNNTNINIDNNKDVFIGIDDKTSEQNIEKEDDDSIPERDFNNFYSTWWSGKNEHYQGAGVGLAIKKELAKRVYRTEFIDGRAILADLQLKQNVKIRIIVLYMPADPKQVNEHMSITNQIEC
jgi:hypothetical protein